MICQSNHHLPSPNLPGQNEISPKIAKQTPEIKIIEASLPSSINNSPLKLEDEIDPFRKILEMEQTRYLKVPSLDEDSDEEDSISLEQDDFIEVQENKFNYDDKILIPLNEQSTKGFFTKSRNNALDDIHEEDSSEMDEDDYVNNSISDSASYDVALHYNQGLVVTNGMLYIPYYTILM